MSMTSILMMLESEYDEHTTNTYIVRAMCLPKSIVLNNSLLLDNLILGLFSIYKISPY